MVVGLQERSDLSGIVTERLEAEICELAGQIAAATARWALLIAEYDSRQGWAQFGCQSAAHWLSWKCGVGMQQLHNRSERAVNGGAEALRQRHRDLGIDIVPDTIIGNYCGDRLDMAYAVSVLTRQNVPAGTSTARGAEKR